MQNRFAVIYGSPCIYSISANTPRAYFIARLFLIEINEFAMSLFYGHRQMFREYDFNGLLFFSGFLSWYDDLNPNPGLYTFYVYVFWSETFQKSSTSFVWSSFEEMFYRDSDPQHNGFKTYLNITTKYNRYGEVYEEYIFTYLFLEWSSAACEQERGALRCE